MWNSFEIIGEIIHIETIATEIPFEKLLGCASSMVKHAGESSKASH